MATEPGELVEPAPEQLLAAPAVVAAVGVAHEAQATIRCDPRDELGLGVHHGAVAGLARRQAVERLAPLGQGAVGTREQRVQRVADLAELVPLVRRADLDRHLVRRVGIDPLDRSGRVIMTCVTTAIETHPIAQMRPEQAVGQPAQIQLLAFARGVRQRPAEIVVELGRGCSAPLTMRATISATPATRFSLAEVRPLAYHRPG